METQLAIKRADGEATQLEKLQELEAAAEGKVLRLKEKYEAKLADIMDEMHALKAESEQSTEALVDALRQERDA